MNSWLKPVSNAISLNNAFVLLTVIETKGSTPCSRGDKIVFAGGRSIFGSIGGGNLEFKALGFAKNLLSVKINTIHLEKYPLGATLGQCCGGYVKVMFESFVETDSSSKKFFSWVDTAASLIEKNQDFVIATLINKHSEKEHSYQKFVYSNDNNIAFSSESKLPKEIHGSVTDLMSSPESPSVIQFNDESGLLTEICLEKVECSEIQAVAVFGAGHISRALMSILTKLPVNIYWIDDRPLQFEQYQGDTSQINIICDDFSSGLIDLPVDSYCLVITYSHQIDFEICEKIISKNKFSYLGMIGSAIKGKKFRDRFLQKGYPEKTVDKFTCPIGEKQKFLKSPTAIAVTIAMDLINFLEQKKQTATL